MKIVADKAWNVDDVIAYIKETGKVDVEEDNFGNIVLYACLHEDDDGRLVEGNKDEDGEVLL